jgi:hypothetical protein
MTGDYGKFRPVFEGPLTTLTGAAIASISYITEARN